MFDPRTTHTGDSKCAPLLTYFNIQKRLLEMGVFDGASRVCFFETSLRHGGRKQWVIDENFTIAQTRRFHGCCKRGSDEYSSYKSQHCLTGLILTSECHLRGSVNIFRLIFVPSDIESVIV